MNKLQILHRLVQIKKTEINPNSWTWDYEDEKKFLKEELNTLNLLADIENFLK